MFQPEGEESEPDRQTDRKACRQAGRQAGRQTHRHTTTQTYIHTERDDSDMKQGRERKDFLKKRWKRREFQQ